MSILHTNANYTLYSNFAVLNNTLFRVNGIDRNQAYVGTSTRNMGIRMNGGAPTDLKQIAGGSLTDGATYQYYYTYYNATQNIESDPSASASILLAGNTQVTFDIPANASVDSQVTHVNIYRTNANGNVFYYDQRLAYTGALLNDQPDTLADTSLGDAFGELDITGILQTNTHGLPYTCPYIISHLGRIFLAGGKTYNTGTITTVNGDATIVGSGTSWTDGMAGMYIKIQGTNKVYTIDSVTDTTHLEMTEAFGSAGAAGLTYTIYGDKNILFYSYIDLNANSRPEYFPADHFVPVNPDDNDSITGLGIIGTRLVVTKRNAIYALSGNDHSNFVLYKITSAIGCVAHRTICNDSSGRMIFLSDKGVYLYNGDNHPALISTNIKGFFNRLSNTSWTINENRLEDAHAVFEQNNNRLWLWVSSDDSVINDKCLVADFNLIDENGQPEWFVFNISANCSAIVKNLNNEQEIHFCDEQGFEYYIDYTATNDGAGNSGGETRRGTVTSATANTLTDSTANFATSGNGLKGVYVTILSGSGIGQRKLIASNTSDTLTISGTWSVIGRPNTDSVYAIGAMNSYWKSKSFTWDDLRYKCLKWVKMIFRKKTSSYDLSVTRYSDFTITDNTAYTDYYGGTETQYIDMSLYPSEQKKLYFTINKAVKHQIKFGINDVDRPFTVRELEIAFHERGRT